MTDDLVKRLETQRNLYKGKYRALLKLVSRTRDKLVQVTDHIEDEGDRVYFGSTNHADALRNLFHEMEAWIWDAIDETNRMKSDPYADLRSVRKELTDVRTEIEQLEAECFKLAAGQCLYDDGTGLIGDEGGNSICAKDKRIKQLEAKIEDLYAQIHCDDERREKLEADKAELVEALNGVTSVAKRRALVIRACDKFFKEAMPKMNVKDSFLDANAIDAWNKAEVAIATERRETDMEQKS